MNTNILKKKRSCLMCGVLFNSNGPQNRRCKRCNHLVETRSKFGASDIPVFKYVNIPNSNNASWDYYDFKIF